MWSRSILAGVLFLATSNLAMEILQRSLG